MNILVLCTGNSARSILLEHILKSKGVNAFSAGSQPTGKVHPQSITLLTAHGFDVSDARSKSWDEFGAENAPHMDAVITVCGSAADEVCPIWPGAPVQAHWGVDDPAKADTDDWEDAFETAFTILNKRATAFLNMSEDTDLKTRLNAVKDIT